MEEQYTSAAEGSLENAEDFLTKVLEGFELGSSWEEDSGLKPVVNELCDCMLHSTKFTCKVFQVVYIIILVTLVSVLLCY